MTITQLKAYAQSNNVTVVKRSGLYEIYHNDNPNEVETSRDISSILPKIHSVIYGTKASVLFN